MIALRLLIHVVFALALLGAGAIVTLTDPHHLIVGCGLLASAALTIGYAIMTIERARILREPDQI